MPSPVSPERVRLPERYRVVRHLRAGGMATLWQAHDELLDRDVAVKVLAEHLSADPAGRQRFEREARAAARLSAHPHVVTIYDVGECAGSAYIVMELMARGSLADRLAAAGAVPRERALDWLADAAAALDDAHAAGIVHRDVKPGNMLIDARGRLALADFGIARVAREEHLTLTGEILGTMAYIAPEQSLGRPATPASDRYALAVVAYELLVGRRPFDAPHPAAQARAHVEDEPPPSGSPGLDGVLRRGLAKEPAERWGSAGAFVTALRRCIGAGAPAPATVRARAPRTPAGVAVPEPATRPARPRSRTPRLAAGALALLLAGVVLAAVLGGSGDDPGGATSATRGAKATRTSAARTTAKPVVTQPRTTTAAPAPTAAAPKPAASPGDPAAARRLQVAGYQARLAGRLDEALGLDRRVLAACGPARALDPCGYALFEAGAVLRRQGRGKEAVALLQQRLRDYGDNGSGEVARELALAQGPRGPKARGKPKRPH